MQADPSKPPTRQNPTQPQHDPARPNRVGGSKVAARQPLPSSQDRMLYPRDLLTRKMRELASPGPATGVLCPFLGGPQHEDNSARYTGDSCDDQCSSARYCDVNGES